MPGGVLPPRGGPGREHPGPRGRALLRAGAVGPGRRGGPGRAARPAGARPGRRPRRQGHPGRRPARRRRGGGRQRGPARPGAGPGRQPRPLGIVADGAGRRDRGRAGRPAPRGLRPGPAGRPLLGRGAVPPQPRRRGPVAPRAGAGQRRAPARPPRRRRPPRPTRRRAGLLHLHLRPRGERRPGRLVPDHPPRLGGPRPPHPPRIHPGRPDWTPRAPALARTVRLWPHHLRGEGHFIAKLGRPGSEAEPAAGGSGPSPGPGGRGAVVEAWRGFAAEALVEEPVGVRVVGERVYGVVDEEVAAAGVRLVRPGLLLGRVRPGRFEPAHALGMAAGPGLERRGRSWTTARRRPGCGVGPWDTTGRAGGRWCGGAAGRWGGGGPSGGRSRTTIPRVCVRCDLPMDRTTTPTATGRGR